MKDKIMLTIFLTILFSWLYSVGTGDEIYTAKEYENVAVGCNPEQKNKVEVQRTGKRVFIWYQDKELQEAHAKMLIEANKK